MNLVNKPDLVLVGKDGNAFAIMGAAKRVARKTGWDKAKIDALLEDAMSGDYDHLLSVMLKNFNVS